MSGLSVLICKINKKLLREVIIGVGEEGLGDLGLVDKDFFPAKIDFIDSGSPMNKYIEVATYDDQSVV